MRRGDKMKAAVVAGLAVAALATPVFYNGGEALLVRDGSASLAALGRRATNGDDQPEQDQQPGAVKTDHSKQLPLFTIGVLAAIALTFVVFWGLHYLFRRRARRAAAALADEKRAAETAAAAKSAPSEDRPKDADFLSLPPYDQRVSKREAE